MSLQPSFFSSFQQKTFLIVFTVSIIIFLIGIFWPKGTVSKGNDSIESFAQCLTDRKLVMYGSDICENCQTQKKMFEKAFEKITYVNCDFQKQECLEKDISFYPAWVKENQVTFGIQPFSKLSALTGCTEPKLS